MGEYTQITLDEWVQMKERLKKDLIGVQESFVRIGYTLRRIEDQKLYEQDGYKNITEFAKAEYGLNASTVSRFKAINRKYSVNGYSDQLRLEFAQYGSSKLAEMLSLPDQDMELIKPEATRDSIRELKQFNKEKPKEGIADDTRELIRKFFEEKQDIASELYSSKAYQSRDLKRVAEIVMQGEERTYRKGLYFLVIYKEGLKVKKHGSLPESMSWDEFFSVAKDVLGEMMAADIADAAGCAMDPEESEAEPIAAKEAKADLPESLQSVDSETGQAAAGDENRNADTEEESKPPESIGSEAELRPVKIAPAQKNNNISSQEEDESAEIDRIVTEEPERAANDKEREESADDSEADETRKNDQKHENESKPEAEPGAETEESSENVEFPSEGPYMIRKEYMNALTPYQMAHYITEEYERHSLPASALACPSQLVNWLTRDVDGKGKDIVDV